MNKEAIVILLDVNSSMNKSLKKEERAGQNENGEKRIKTAKDSIRMLLEQKLLNNPKHDIGLVLFGTAETDNRLNQELDQNQYKNVQNLRYLGPVDLEFFRSVQNIDVEPQQQESGDLVDALIVGLDMLLRFTGTKKYRKRIFLITDGEKQTKIQDQEFFQIAKTIQDNEVKLNCITLDFCNDIDDEDEEEEEESASKNAKKNQKNNGETDQQQINKDILLNLQKETGCAIIPVETAIELYNQFKKKEYAARSKFKGNLEISPDLLVAVQIFTKTKEESVPSLKKYSKNLPENDSADACKIKLERTYTEVDDPDQKEIPQSDLRKAYNYGKQLVPVSVENEHVLKLQKNQKKSQDQQQNSQKNGKTKSEDHSQIQNEDIKIEQDGIEKQFKLLGFTSQQNVPRHHFMAGVDIILPIKGQKNERAFAAMVYAMIETKKVLIAKIVERKNADPKLVVLYPHVSKKQPLLYSVQLPTVEDIRDYQFPSLVQSTDKQRQAAAKLIQKMDLCQQEIESDEENEQLVINERLAPEDTYNPTIQYFNQVVTHKVVNPDQANIIPPLNDAIQRQMQIDPELEEQIQEEADEFDQAFKIIINEDDKKEGSEIREGKKRIYWRDIIEREQQRQEANIRLLQNQEVDEQQITEQRQPLTEQEAARLKGYGKNGDIIDAFGADDSVKQIGSVNPIQDFKKMISDRKVDRVESALNQMKDIIDRYIRGSINGDIYDKALECLLELRQACVSEDEAPFFNKFMETLKEKYSHDTHKDFFGLLIKKKISLITSAESELSSIVTAQEAENFLKLSIQKPQKKEEVKQFIKKDDDFDLIE